MNPRGEQSVCVFALIIAKDENCDIQVNALAPGWIETDPTEFVKTIPLYQEVITSPVRLVGFRCKILAGRQDFFL